MLKNAEKSVNGMEGNLLSVDGVSVFKEKATHYNRYQMWDFVR